MADKYDEYFSELSQHLIKAKELMDTLLTTPMGKITDFKAHSDEIEAAKERLDEAYKVWRAFWNV